MSDTLAATGAAHKAVENWCLTAGRRQLVSVAVAMLEITIAAVAAPAGGHSLMARLGGRGPRRGRR
jgi:hypothetical protein